MSDDPTIEDAPKRAGGRPSKYDPAFVDKVREMCDLGATDLEIADSLGISGSTLYAWKNAYPEFSEAIRAGKDRADDRVERALYNRAVGYSFDSEKVFQFQGQVVRAETREHVPPDSSAAFIWLKNRRSKEWRDKQEIAHSGEITVGGVSGLLAAVKNAKPDAG